MRCRVVPWLGNLMSGVALGSENPPTYHSAVSRILQGRCQESHRPGQVAPFSLLNYDQARKRAHDIAAVVRTRIIPSRLRDLRTRLDIVAHFDNSAANPINPTTPPALVRWGEQTNDELCIGFLHYTRDREHLDGQPPPRQLDPLGDWRP